MFLKFSSSCINLISPSISTQPFYYTPVNTNPPSFVTINSKRNLIIKLCKRASKCNALHPLNANINKPPPSTWGCSPAAAAAAAAAMVVVAAAGKGEDLFPTPDSPLRFPHLTVSVLLRTDVVTDVC